MCIRYEILPTTKFYKIVFLFFLFFLESGYFVSITLEKHNTEDSWECFSNKTFSSLDMSKAAKGLPFLVTTCQ